jgi:hypothetical protein
MLGGFLTSVEKAPQFQKIVHAKRRSASGHAIKGVCRRHVRHIGQQGLELPAWTVVEDPILTPGELPRYQFVFGATKWMKGMGYTESSCSGPYTICIR